MTICYATLIRGDSSAVVSYVHGAIGWQLWKRHARGRFRFLSSYKSLLQRFISLGAQGAGLATAPPPLEACSHLMTLSLLLGTNRNQRQRINGNGQVRIMFLVSSCLAKSGAALVGSNPACQGLTRSTSSKHMIWDNRSWVILV